MLPVKVKKNVLDFSEQHVSFLNLLINEQPCLAFYEYFSTILTFFQGRKWQVRRGQLPPRFWQNRRCHWAVVVLCIKVEKKIWNRERVRSKIISTLLLASPLPPNFGSHLHPCFDLINENIFVYSVCLFIREFRVNFKARLAYFLHHLQKQ